jgi:co-chaperonin GroES (HSP10)
MTAADLRPLARRVLIAPDRAPTETASGLILPGSGLQMPPMSGTVVRVGEGGYRERGMRRATVATCLHILDDAQREAASSCEALTLARDEMVRYMMRVATDDPVCRVGDHVVFPMEAGHEIVMDEQTGASVLLMSEESLLAVTEAGVSVEGVAA